LEPVQHSHDLAKVENRIVTLNHAFAASVNLGA
jgi:hypothetical protein